MKNIILLLLILTITAVSSADNRKIDNQYNVAFPGKIIDLNYIGARNYEKAELGYSVRYENKDNTKLDIYIYNNGLTELSKGLKDPRIRQMFDASENDLKAAIDAKYYRSAMLDDLDTNTLSKLLDGKYLSKKHTIIYGPALQKMDGVEMDSYTIMTGLNGNILKLRISAPKENHIKTEYIAKIAETVYELFKL